MSHNHDHSHGIKNYNKAFAIGIALNTIYIVLETVYGLLVNSMALIADAGHNLSDVLGLILAWGASHLAQKAVTKTKTYGMKKSTILAALFNAIILFIAVGAILIETIRKLIEPDPVAGITVMIVAGIGVIVNTITALLFVKGRENDINIKGAFLHMAADAAVSLGVVIGGLVINYTGWYLIDPIIGIVIVAVITFGTWGLLKDAFHLSMDAVPRDIDFEEVKKYLSSFNKVEGVHDLHIWPMSTTETALTVHIIAPKINDTDNFIHQIVTGLDKEFNIHHSTIQIESDPKCDNCNLH